MHDEDVGGVLGHMSNSAIPFEDGMSMTNSRASDSDERLGRNVHQTNVAVRKCEWAAWAQDSNP